MEGVQVTHAAETDRDVDPLSWVGTGLSGARVGLAPGLSGVARMALLGGRPLGHIWGTAKGYPARCDTRK